MNAIQIKERVELYLDSERNGRFNFQAINKAVNDAIEKYIIAQLGDVRDGKIFGFQAVQQVRDNLYTLITAANPSISANATIQSRYYSFFTNAFTFPTNYFMFVSLQGTVSGMTDYIRPTSHNEIGPLLNDSFRHPTNKKMYFLETSSGMTIYREASGTLSQLSFVYIKEPATFSIGNESNLINAGAGVLTNATSYIAVEQSVHNGVTYVPGTQFTSVNTNLTSGQVILAANTTTCDLPERTHEDISKMAAAILSGVVSDVQRYQIVEKEAGNS